MPPTWIPEFNSIPEALPFIIGAIGAVLLVYAVFLEQERRQDLLNLLGAVCVFIYAFSINNLLFMIAMAGFGIASLVEFIEIYIGLHKGSPENLKKYKSMR